MKAFNKKTRILLFGAFSCMLVKTLAEKKKGKRRSKNSLYDKDSNQTNSGQIGNLIDIPMEPAKFMKHVSKLSSPVLLF